MTLIRLATLILLPWVLLAFACSSAFSEELECSWIYAGSYALCVLDIDDDGAYERTERLFKSGETTAYTLGYDTGDVLKALVFRDGLYSATDDPTDIYFFPGRAKWLCRPSELSSCAAE